MTTQTAKDYARQLDMEIASSILDQLGGREFLAVTGARQLVAHDRALLFNLPRYNHAGYITQVKILLTAADDYTVLGFQPDGKLLQTHDGVHNDQLIETCERMTGLVFRMPRVRQVYPRPKPEYDSDRETFEDYERAFLED